MSGWCLGIAAESNGLKKMNLGKIVKFSTFFLFFVVFFLFNCLFGHVLANSINIKMDFCLWWESMKMSNSSMMRNLQFRLENQISFVFFVLRRVNHFPQGEQQRNSGKRRFSAAQCQRIWMKKKEKKKKPNKNQKKTLRHLRAGARIQIDMHFQRGIFSVVHKLGASIISLFEREIKKNWFKLTKKNTFCVNWTKHDQTEQETKLSSHVMLKEGSDSFGNEFSNSIQLFVSLVQTHWKLFQHRMQPVETRRHFFQLQKKKKKHQG